MPFTTKVNRRKMIKYLKTGEIPTKQIHPAVTVPDIDVGDWCFVFYRAMVREWKESPRWTTAHNIYKKMREQIETMGLGFGNKENLNSTKELSIDQSIAYELAWQVFFVRYVMPYELKKIEENGDVDDEDLIDVWV